MRNFFSFVDRTTVCRPMLWKKFRKDKHRLSNWLTKMSFFSDLFLINRCLLSKLQWWPSNLDTLRMSSPIIFSILSLFFLSYVSCREPKISYWIVWVCFFSGDLCLEYLNSVNNFFILQIEIYSNRRKKKKQKHIDFIAFGIKDFEFSHCDGET